MSTKTELMQSVIAGRAIESFEYHEEGTGTVTYYNVTKMRQRAKAEGWPIIVVGMDQVLDFMLHNRVWENSRVFNLYPDSFLNDPAMAVVSTRADGTVEHCFIDGVHRIIRRWKEGMDTVLVYEARGAQVELVDRSNFIQRPGADWGDALVAGKIVKRN